MFAWLQHKVFAAQQVLPWPWLLVPGERWRGHTGWSQPRVGQGRGGQAPWHLGASRARKGFPINAELEMARSHLAGVGWICRGSACSHLAAQVSAGHGAAGESTAAFLALFLGRNVPRAAKAFISKQEEQKQSLSEFPLYWSKDN